MADGGTNVLFVPYRPKSKTTRSPPEDKSVISQQKHAAREYHRKAKLERTSKLNAAQTRQTRSSSIPLLESQHDASIRPVLPRSRSFPDDEQHDTSFAIVDAGTGQLDPFNASVPMGVPPYTLDILDYGSSTFESSIELCLAHYPVIAEPSTQLTSTQATSNEWRVFNSATNVLDEGAIKTAVMACAMQSRAAFWTIIFAGAVHSAYQRGHDDSGHDRTLRLSYKTQAIKELNNEIQSLQGPASDELLLAIITLAAHGSGEQLDPPPPQESLSILEAVQNFQYYGSMRWEVAHLNAIAHLVNQKGGLHTIKMPGLANAIGLADIFFAFQDLRAPIFPLLAPTTVIMSTWPPPSPQASESLLQNMTTGFEEFVDIDGMEPLMQIVSNAHRITVGFAEHLANYPEAPTLTRIVWARNFLAHDLLSLPSTLLLSPDSPFSDSQDGITPCPSPRPLQAIYTLLRHSLLTYALLVLFPLPRSTNTHAKLSHQLMLALKECTALNLWRKFPELLLWSTILGGVVAGEGEADSGLREWFAEMARQVRARSMVEGLGPKKVAEPGEGRAEKRTQKGTAEKGKARGGGGRRSQRQNRGKAVHSSPEATTPTQDVADTSWTIVRDLCASFLWFSGLECEGAGRLFWIKSFEEDVERSQERR